MNTRIAMKSRSLLVHLMVTLLFCAILINVWNIAYAQDEPPDAEVLLVEEINPYFTLEHIKLSDGTLVSKHIIHGPSHPLPEFEAERQASIQSTDTAITLPDFPSFNWVFGCSAVSGAMIAGYYDRGAYLNMYTGPTNGGVMPLTDTSWPTWTDIAPDTYPNNPLIASHQGVDGLATYGSIDDYWVQFNSTADDPYIGFWTQHTWGTAIGDYMKTSQSAEPYSNIDGSTSFYNYTAVGDRLTCGDMEGYNIDEIDGTYGRKLFYEARGYTITDCYNQPTDNRFSEGFSLSDFQAEIDAGHAVLLNLVGHSVVGYGYEGSTIWIRDTWSNNLEFRPTMPWGGSYEGMAMDSVSVVHLAPPPVEDNIKVFLPLVIKQVSNQSPTDISLSSSSVLESQPINTVVGVLSAVDPNVGDTFTYTLVSGDGDSGNGSFNISGDQLRTSVIFEYDTQNSYSIRVRVTDQGGLSFEKAFTISVTEAAEAVILNGDFELGQVDWTEYSSNGWDLIFEGSFAHGGDWLAWLGGGNNEISRLSQTFTMPVETSFLHYWYVSYSEDICGFDYFRIKVNSTTVFTRNLCNSNNTDIWVEASFSLAGYENTTITLMFEVTTNSMYFSSLFLDDISLSTTAGVMPGMTLPEVLDQDRLTQER